MTHHTDAELLRDIEEHMRKMWDARLLPAVCWPADLAQRLTQAVRRAPAAPVPQKGWRYVPEVLTPEMKREFMDMLMDGIDIYMNSNDQIEIQTDAPRRIWKSILAAAPQPPEAAPVPQFSRIAQKKLDYLLEAGEAITGYAIENKDGRRGAIDCHGFVYWWQDAAQEQST